MQPITFESMAEILIDRFPELRPRYEDELKWWGEQVPGCYIIYEDIFCPHIIELLESERTPATDQQLRSVFDFLEELALNPDIHVRDVAAIGICEGLLGHPAIVERAKRYVRPATHKLFDDIEAR